MKYFKLGLLAVTLSLTALVIALDKKENRKNVNKSCSEMDEDVCESCSSVIME
ncbi:hypothetical protein [Candidatus Arthromitus sp. SFB-rat-Yit]|uniref:hypothetical protein n=1 Tax=Candidatus Arthromitus sp. SFB-rat-Yit TaxID=1041504 RepID=UPI0002D39AD1|nr:hypothetical protein [Candidatus Arthromitus sp. SFB-rat-Yit]